MVRMEEVAVKQGSLHLQQQQTFGKVKASPGWGWAERATLGSFQKSWGGAVCDSLTFVGPVHLPRWTSGQPWEGSFLTQACVPNQASKQSPNCALCCCELFVLVGGGGGRRYCLNSSFFVDVQWVHLGREWRGELGEFRIQRGFLPYVTP